MFIFWISIQSLFPNVAKNTYPQNKPCFQGVQHITTTIFQVVLYAIADISWKFHENLFIYLSIMLQTDTPSCLDGKPWNSLVRCETVYLIISCVVLDISWKFHENPFTRFSIIVLTITDSENRKFDPEFKGLMTTTRKYSRLFFVSCAIFPENFMKIRSSIFPLCC